MLDNLCCGEIELDYEQVDRELDEIYQRQRYRCLETKEPRKIENDQNEKTLLSVNNKQKNRRGLSVPSSDMGDTRHRRSSSVPSAKTRPWNAKGKKHRGDNKKAKDFDFHASHEDRFSPRGRNYAAKSHEMNHHTVSRSWSLDSRKNGLRSRNASHPWEQKSHVTSHGYGYPPYGGGMNPNYKTQISPSRSTSRSRALPPKSQPYSMYNHSDVDRPSRSNTNQRFTSNKPRSNAKDSRQGNPIGFQHQRRNRAYSEDRDESASWSSTGDGSNRADLGMGLFW